MMPLEDLKDALEGRGFAVDGNQKPSLAGLLPLFPEPDLSWLGRARRLSWPLIPISASSATRTWFFPI